MNNRRFRYEVANPLEKLIERTSKNVLIDTQFSDVLTLAKQVAISVYHFREVVFRTSREEKLGPMSDELAECVRQKLLDVADSAKHGRLRQSAREVQFTGSLAFEYNSSLGFRFLRTEVWAENARWGQYEIVDTVTRYASLLMEELEIGDSLNIRNPAYSFSEWAETFVLKNGLVKPEDVSSCDLSFYERSGERLVPVDPPEVRFRICELRQT